MLYNIKEYTFKFDTPLKKMQELLIVNTIFILLNNNKYDNLDELLKYNASYDAFLKKNSLTNVVRHFGNNMSESDFIEICNNIRKYISSKKQFSEENIIVSTFGEPAQEYVSYVGGNEAPIHIDNSLSKEPIIDQMKKKQQETNNPDFTTTNPKENTNNMIKSLADNDKVTLNFKPLYSIALEQLSKDDVKKFEIAFSYQEYVNYPILVDLSRGLIWNPNNKKMIKIDDVKQKIDEGSSRQETMGYQKVKVSQNAVPSTIYTDMSDSV
jgi:hypothetical protein